MQCTNCGSQQPEGAAFCDNCGMALDPSQPHSPHEANGAAPPNPSLSPAPEGDATNVAEAPICPSCGTQMIPGAAFCDNCGQPLSQPQPSSDQSADQADQSAAGGPAEQEFRCSQCGTVMEPGSNFCDQCGASISSTPSPSQAESASANFVSRPPHEKAQKSQAGRQGSTGTRVMPQDLQEQSQAPATDVSRYQPPVPARLVVQGSSFPLPFPGGKSEWIVGREDPISGKFPDFDLTDHGGDELGVSREHARISKRGEQFFVEDLQSTNYTFVNQQQLQPGQSHPLSDGDELCFGRLKFNFYLS